MDKIIALLMMLTFSIPGLGEEGWAFAAPREKGIESASLRQIWVRGKLKTRNGYLDSALVIYGSHATSHVLGMSLYIGNVNALRSKHPAFPWDDFRMNAQNERQALLEVRVEGPEPYVAKFSGIVMRKCGLPDVDGSALGFIAMAGDVPHQKMIKIIRKLVAGSEAVAVKIRASPYSKMSVEAAFPAGNPARDAARKLAEFCNLER